MTPFSTFFTKHIGCFRWHENSRAVNYNTHSKMCACEYKNNGKCDIDKKYFCCFFEALP